MASVSCTEIRHKHYNGGWQPSYESDLHGGYAGDTSRKFCTVMRFKTPVISGQVSGGVYTYKLKVTIPYVRSDGNSTMAKEGTFYLRLQTSDFTDINNRPTSSNNTATVKWTANDVEVHTVTATITLTNFNPAKATTYYLIINSSKFIEVGHTGHDKKWEFAIDYSDYYTAVGKGTVKITDNYNNTFSITGTQGANGTNNKATGYSIKWSYNTNYDQTVSNPNALTINTATDATRTVRAKITTTATKGSSSTNTGSEVIKQYVAPANPGKPVLSYSKNRLTIKENWSYSWTAASQINSSSPVTGYRLILYKNGVSIAIKGSSGEVVPGALRSTAGTWYWDSNYKVNGKPTLNIYPAHYGFVPGDKIKLLVKAYTQNGKNNDGTKMLSSTWISSDELTVQNAGVVNVKVGGAWSEGQVYVKVGGAWREAETVQTKVGGNWKESQ